VTAADGTETGSPSNGRPLRVVHLDHTSVAGGAEFALLRMLRAQPPWSPHVLVAPASGRRLGIYGDVPARIPVQITGVRQPAGASSAGFGAALGVGARVLAQAIAVRCTRAFASADLADANTARAAAYGAVAARLSRKPFVVHLRDLVDPDALGRSGHTLMVRVVLPRADGVIANSHATLESARGYLRPGVPAEVIPSASGLHRGSAPGAPAGDGRVRTIGMLARIDPWKGQHVLLEAFARAFRDGAARLQFAGQPLFGSEHHLEELRRSAEALGVADRVDFLGHVDDIDGLLATWDVAVQASTRPEPLGQNVLQYLAAGRAVVAADEGGPAEWITDGGNGLLVPPRDVDALATALGRLDADAALRMRLATAAAATPGLLDDAAVARAHEAFYRRVVAWVDARRDARTR
jgi:glycosyltransferase involved in cell wall biosynthesis